MKKELTFCVDTQITIIYDDERCNAEDAIKSGHSLAFNPNMHTIEEGVQIKTFTMLESRYSNQTRKEHNLPPEGLFDYNIYKS